MKNLNTKQIKSLQNLIETNIPLDGLSFGESFEKSDDGIEFVVCERYNYKIKIIYVLVPLEINEQFDKLKQLEKTTRELCDLKDAQFGYFGTCTFENGVAKHLMPNDHQIERLR